MTYVKEKEWLTLNEVSSLTGKSLNSIRLLVHRKKIGKVKKIQDKKRSYWLIHKDSLPLTYIKDICQNSDVCQELPEICQEGILDVCQKDNLPKNENISKIQGDDSDICHAVIPFTVYDMKQKEWTNERDKLLQGLTMYQYKLEEYESKFRLLPAPVETIADELKTKEALIIQAQKILEEAQEKHNQQKIHLAELQQKLIEEEKAKEAYRLELERAKKPWWKKILSL